MELIASQVVVVARQFNPSIFTQVWLTRHGVVDENAFESGCVFVEGLAQVATRDFHLLVLPDRLQFTPRPNANHDRGFVSNTISRIVRALPHTPYVAVGINFTWHEAPGQDGIAALTRRLFANPNRLLYREFAGEDAHFGAYMSKDVRDGVRLKLDIKPIIAGNEDPPGNRLQLHFNFHHTLAGEALDQQVVNSVERWPEWLQQSEALAELALSGGTND